jgi:hypothetical protein
MRLDNKSCSDTIQYNLRCTKYKIIEERCHLIVLESLNDIDEHRMDCALENFVNVPFSGEGFGFEALK